MRTTERIFGVLASVLGLMALVLSLTQRIVQVSTSSVIIYGPGIEASNRLAIFLPLALTTLGVALACLSALLDVHRTPRRGVWLAVLFVGVVVAAIGLWLLSANDVWLDLGETPSSAGLVLSQVSVAALYIPAALAGAVAALSALVRRRPGGAPA